MCHRPKQSPGAQQWVKRRTAASYRLSCFSSRTRGDPGTLSDIKGDERSPAGTMLSSMTSRETGRIQQWPRYPLGHQWRPEESSRDPGTPSHARGAHQRVFQNFRVSYSPIRDQECNCDILPKLTICVCSVKDNRQFTMAYRSDWVFLYFINIIFCKNLAQIKVDTILPANWSTEFNHFTSSVVQNKHILVNFPFDCLTG